MKVLVLNKNNIVSDSNNSKYRFKFNTTVNFKKGAKIAISKINMYFSWENITDAFNNRTFSYNWFDASGNLTKSYPLTIPSGYYSIDDINNWLYVELCNRGHYLTYAVKANALGTSNGNDWTSSTKYVFIEMMENSTYYSCQFRLYSLPNFATSLFTKPTDVSGYEWKVPTQTTVGINTFRGSPKIIIPSTNNFDDIVGLNPGTYGSGSINTNNQFEDVLSTYAPTLDPVGSVLVLCSLSNNLYSSPSNLMDSFTYSVDYGQMIAIENNNLNWIDIAQGSYSEFFVEFKDQNFRNIVIKDPNVLITMVIQEPEE